MTPIDDDSAPTFMKTLFAYLAVMEKEFGMRVYIPYVLISIIILPFAAIYFFKSTFIIKFNEEDAYSIISSVIVVGGMLSAFSISASTQVQDIFSRYPFSDYLKENSLFDYFIFFPQFVFFLQSFLVILGLISILLLAINPAIIPYVVIFNISLSVYVFLKTMSLVDLIRKLTWHSANYNIILSKS